LLNYLVALSFERDKLRFSKDTNLNEIYADLLDAVYERGYEKHGYRLTEGIEKYQFIAILEEIALACWHGDGRTTSVKEIEDHCDNSGLRQILDRFQATLQEDSRASITRLLTAFYFRESGEIRDREKTFEFTHKSFGEYLTAKRIIEGVRLIHEDLEERKRNFRKGCDEREALITWATLCGLSAMDEYLFQFVCDEMRLQDLSKVRDWQKTLCRLIEFMLLHGMPMEGLNPRPNFQEEMRQARNAEEALLAVLNACARVTREISDIHWHFSEDFGIWISRLQGQRFNPLFCLNCLSFLDLRCCFIGYQNLFKANLYGANLYGANLYGANLTVANLQGANLQGANLTVANLQGVNLEGANLTVANLQGVNLQGVNLEGANLEGANLEGTNLHGMHLEGANLQGADLGEVNLQWAKLRGANLERAYLYRANLSRANLQGANLQGANLEEVNLQWAKLRGANLERAYLDRADLEGANLEEASFQGSNLEQANLQGTILEGKEIKSFT